MASVGHRVGHYAPERYILESSHYSQEGTLHVFYPRVVGVDGEPDRPDLDGLRLECQVPVGGDEKAALESFKAAHAPTDPPPPQFVEPDPPTRPGKRK